MPPFSRGFILPISAIILYGSSICPLPIIKTKQEVEKPNLGEVLEFIADDPGAKQDIPS
ncbi:MAG: sulfurtransferase TusA family protein [Elusimicrobiota bacterium]